MTVDPLIFYATLGVVLLIIFGLLYAAARNKETPFEWWQFVSTRGSDGKWHADMDRLGQFAGILIASWAVVTISAKIKDVEITGFNILLTIFLAFVGGVTTYQKYIKSRAGIPSAPKEEKADEVKPNV